MPYDWDLAEFRARQKLDPRLLEEGTISQGNWMDFNPAVKGLVEGAKELVGMSSSERLMKHLRDIKSPVLRPQNAFEWADKGAGIAAETLQTGLAAADLAGIAGAVGPAAGRRLTQTLADETGTFGGGMAKNPPKDPEAWFTGMEGKRKFEIDDSKMALNWDKLSTTQNEYVDVARLGDFVNNDELFKQYPEIKDAKIFVTTGDVPSSPSSLGSFDGKNLWVKHRMSEDETKDVITHEIQHWIQQKEGFARGGSPAAMEQEYNNARARLNFLEQEPDYIEGHKKIDKLWDDVFNTGKISDTEASELDKQIASQYPSINEERSILKRLREFNSQKHSYTYGEDTIGIGQDAYSRLAGEIESRDAAKRRTWPMDLRRTMPPDLRKDAIIRMDGGGAQASVSSESGGQVEDFTKMEPVNVNLEELDWLKSRKE